MKKVFEWKQKNDIIFLMKKRTKKESKKKREMDNLFQISERFQKETS